MRGATRGAFGDEDGGGGVVFICALTGTAEDDAAGVEAKGAVDSVAAGCEGDGTTKSVGADYPPNPPTDSATEPQ